MNPFLKRLALLSVKLRIHLAPFITSAIGTELSIREVLTLQGWWPATSSPRLARGLSHSASSSWPRGLSKAAESEGAVLFATWVWGNRSSAHSGECGGGKPARHCEPLRRGRRDSPIDTSLKRPVREPRNERKDFMASVCFHENYFMLSLKTINNGNKKQRITMELYRLDRGESEPGTESIANPRHGEHGEAVYKSEDR